MAVFKCKMCGASLDFKDSDTIATCGYCGTKQTLPKFLDDRRAELYDRAGHFRRNNEFDKASGIYEHILSEDRMDAEAYWSVVLCRYGIEYVEDPKSGRRMPTINRMQVVSILLDADYKAALEYADEAQRALYEAEATEIARIQKECLAISQKEEPFDVFICYKETDALGNRTQDSVLAQELYYNLTEAGYKTFFARITLEKMLGTAYEPYIFAALNSAKVMVVLGTKPEHFNAVWVKNEWSRYLAMIKNGAKKTLVPAYRGMDPYDLPEAFSYLQAQDMSKLGFMQDMIAGIKKLIGDGEEKKTVATGNLTNMLKRIRMSIADGEFTDAEQRIEKALDIDAENSDAYLYKLLCQLRLRDEKELAEGKVKKFLDNPNYQKAYKFGDEARRRFLEDCVRQSSVEWRKKEKLHEKQMIADRVNEENRSVVGLKSKILAEEQALEAFKKDVEASQTKVVLARVGFWTNLLSAIAFVCLFVAFLGLFVLSGQPPILVAVGMVAMAFTTLLGNILMFAAIKSNFFLVILTVLYNLGGFINQIKTNNYIKRVKRKKTEAYNEVLRRQSEIEDLKRTLDNVELQMQKDRAELNAYDGIYM